MTTALSATRLLEAREQGLHLHPIDQALTIMRLAEPQGADPADLPLAARDRRLLEVRRATFGDAMTCLAECRQCGALLEFELSASALLDALGTVPPPEILVASGCEIQLRPLDSRDLAAAALTSNREHAAALLVRRAMRIVRPEASHHAVPGTVMQLAEARIAERETVADVALDLRCAACGAAWIDGFDIGTYLWAEIDASAQRTVDEVTALARCFGWSEAEILAMSATRRRTYLEAAGLT